MCNAIEKCAQVEMWAVLWIMDMFSQEPTKRGYDGEFIVRTSLMPFRQILQHVWSLKYTWPYIDTLFCKLPSLYSINYTYRRHLFSTASFCKTNSRSSNRCRKWEVKRTHSHIPRRFLRHLCLMRTWSRITHPTLRHRYTHRSSKNTHTTKPWATSIYCRPVWARWRVALWAVMSVNGVRSDRLWQECGYSWRSLTDVGWCDLAEGGVTIEGEIFVWQISPEARGN